MRDEVADVAIVGGGAAGLMIAAAVGRRRRLNVLEANARPGAKIAVSGGGRCNLTHREVSAARYDGDPLFIGKVLERFDERAVLRWFEKRGLRAVRRESGQYFCPRSADEVNAVFRNEIPREALLTGRHVESADHRGGRFILEGKGWRLEARELVVASGGASYPQLGASDIGWRIAERFGHTVVPPAPALVGLTLQPEQFFFRELSGVSVPVEISVGGYRYADRLLFAHRGITGPAVLNASLRWRRGKLHVDFLPGFSWDLLRGESRNLSTVLPLPKRVSRAFLKHLGIRDTAAGRLSQPALERLKALRDYRFAPAGTFGYAKAEVTRGGVATGEVDPETMMSRKIPGLYFAGEVLDVTGEVGGYNFQWAFSSAAVCADALLSRGKASPKKSARI